MASHEVTFVVPAKFVLAKDVEFHVKSNGRALGKLLISKGNIEWVPAFKVVKKRRLSWESFNMLMQSQGKEARIKKRAG